MTIKFGLAAAVTLLLTCGLGAQEKKAKTVNYQGNVQGVNKSTSMILIKNDSVVRSVMYSASTKFMYGHSKDNKPGSVDQVKDGNYISCAGSVEGGHLMATECVYRETK